MPDIPDIFFFFFWGGGGVNSRCWVQAYVSRKIAAVGHCISSTFYIILLISTDNFCKQFGPRSGPIMTA